MTAVVPPSSLAVPSPRHQELPRHDATSHCTQTRSIPAACLLSPDCQEPTLIAAPSPLYRESQRVDLCHPQTPASLSSDKLPAARQTLDFQALLHSVFLVGLS
ncbi:hypothetical protein TcG_13054 [Trypanosoma cruzi]|nr:hypothetical protein TcG_13054 [Trypanosoma cruzi]